MAEKKFTNRLINETSPYLLQHAHNPVDWYPWCKEAFEKAAKEDKPVLLSVGYSACHWCHVMERESFENEQIAETMNDNFVCIKADREERPDVDQIYMNAVQLMTGSGGWPMTVFLTPKGVPFYGGTYFPPVDRHGMPAFTRILVAVAEAYANRRDQIEEQGSELLKEIRSINNFRPTGELLSVGILRKAYHNIAANFDSRFGGFGKAPKFPQPMNLNFILKTYARTGDEEALEILETTLDYMARGGIYDHLGGGFARYSTDERWLVPHFEKMLYDNALLSQVYLHAFQLTGKRVYSRIAEETLNWVLNEMTDPKGGFYSTLDADSEGHEGKFYVWDKDEIEALLGNEAEIFNDYYGVTKNGNFEGKNILFIQVPEEDMALEVMKKHKIGKEELTELLERGRKKLFSERSKRIRPGLDDKVLTAWNGMMIKSFAEAARILNRSDYLEAAVKAADFILTANRQGEKLLRSYKGGQSKLNAYLEDYSYMIDALIALYEATFDQKRLMEAKSLADLMIDQFWDEEEGSFFFTGKDHEDLIVRSKDFSDNATPSGNSVAVDALLRLRLIFDEDQYERKAVKIMEAVSRAMERYSGGFGHMLCALDFYLSKAKEIAIIGTRDSKDAKTLIDVVFNRYLPNKVVAFADPQEKADEETIPLLAYRDMIDGKATAYVCEQYECKEPVSSPDDLAKQLSR